MRRARLAALPLVWVLGATAVLSSCSSQSPEARLQGKLDAITLAANDRDADGVRSAVEEFLDEVAVQSREGMASSRVKRLRDLANAVLKDADLIDERVTEAEASASAAAQASRSAAAAASASAAAAAAAQASASAAAAASASAAAAASASAAAESESPEPEPSESDDGGIIPTSGTVGGGNSRPSPTPTPSS